MSDKTLREAAHLALAALEHGRLCALDTAREYGNSSGSSYGERTLAELHAKVDQMDKAMAALSAALAAPDEPANFCPRCGKRTNADLIHTCTPPRPVDHAKPLYAAPQPAIQGAKE